MNCGGGSMATERYHPLFAADLRDACKYYDSITETLGRRFRVHVRSTLGDVVDRPESFGRIGGEFRGALLERFPYVVVFTIDKDITTVFGLRHAASDRKNWFDRTMASDG